MTADTTTAPELLPCPFCGWTNVSVFGPVGWYRQYGITHSCQAFFGGSGDFTIGAHSKEAAVAAWNRRAPVAQDAEPVAWRLKDIEQGVVEYTSRKDRADHRTTIPGFEVTPLYARPVPQPSDEAAEAERQAALRLQQVELIARAEKEAATLRAQLAEAEKLAKPMVIDWNGVRAVMLSDDVVYVHGDDYATVVAERDDARTALAAAEDHADVLAEALHHMVNASVHPDQMADEALAAHQARRAGE